MISMPRGEVYMDELKRENIIAMIDNPSREDIDFLFNLYPSAKKLIYAVPKGEKREYLREEDQNGNNKMVIDLTTARTRIVYDCICHNCGAITLLPLYEAKNLSFCPHCAAPIQIEQKVKR